MANYLTEALVYKAIDDARPSPSFRNIQDRIAITVHAAFIASGFRLLATGPDSFHPLTLQSPSREEVSIKDWNSSEDGFYGFIYFNPELDLEKVVVHIIDMHAGTVLVYGSRVGDSTTTRLDIKYDHLENFGNLVGYIEKGLVKKFDGGLSDKKYHYLRHVCDASCHGKCNCVDYQLIDISDDGFVSLLTDYGGTKDDLMLPSDDNLREQIQDMFDEGKDLVVSVMMSAIGEEYICAVKDIGGGSK